VALGNIVDELHDEHGLAHTSAAKEANLATTLVGSKQVHNLRCKWLLSGNCSQNLDTSGYQASNDAVNPYSCHPGKEMVSKRACSVDIAKGSPYAHILIIRFC
jgi:hypothetical protein